MRINKSTKVVMILYILEEKVSSARIVHGLNPFNGAGGSIDDTNTRHCLTRNQLPYADIVRSYPKGEQRLLGVDLLPIVSGIQKRGDLILHHRRERPRGQILVAGRTRASKVLKRKMAIFRGVDRP